MKAPASQPPSHRRRRQRGTTLLEALVAFLVLSLGMLTVARVQTQLRLNADIARQRSEAVRLAQEDIETLRSFTTIVAAGGGRSYDAIASSSRTVDASAGRASNTAYLVTRRIEPADVPHAKAALVNVGWTDRGGGSQQVTLSAIFSGSDPAYSGALGLARSGEPVGGAYGRSIRVPLAARNLGDGRSVLKPLSTGTVALVFDNATGAVTGRCTGINATTDTRDLVKADLASCDTTAGQLISGIVRFSMSSPPDAAHGNEAPPALAVEAAAAGGAAWCAVEPVKTVSYSLGGSQHLDTVAMSALPASLGVPAWAETGDRFVAYQCVVYASGGSAWSGRVTIAPIGWTIGIGPADRRVCRYSSDLDGSGTIAANIEHPADYANVTTALPNQNFLVVRGTENCPASQAAQAGSRGAGRADMAVDLSTVQQQP